MLLRSTNVVGAGVELAPGEILTVEHVAPEDEVEVVTPWRTLHGRVIRREPGFVWITTNKEGRHGESGSPAYKNGALIGLLEGNHEHNWIGFWPSGNERCTECGAERNVR